MRVGEGGQEWDEPGSGRGQRRGDVCFCLKNKYLDGTCVTTESRSEIRFMFVINTNHLRFFESKSS